MSLINFYSMSTNQHSYQGDLTTSAQRPVLFCIFTIFNIICFVRVYILNNNNYYCKITLRKMCFRSIKQKLGETRLNDTFYKTVSFLYRLIRTNRAQYSPRFYSNSYLRTFKYTWDHIFFQILGFFNTV